MANTDDVVAKFWTAINDRDTELLASTLAPAFVRIGMSGEEQDISRGRDVYLEFAGKNLKTHEAYTHEVLHHFYSPDRRLAVAETLETITNPGQPSVVLQLLNIFELNEEGLLTKLSLYWKTPLEIPDSWRAVEGIRIAR